MREPPVGDVFEEERDSWFFVDVDTKDNRLLKTDILKYCQYEKVIYLDCDTFVLGDLGSAGKILDYFDIGMRLKRKPQRRVGKGEVDVLGGMKVQDLPHWNSGVILARNTSLAWQFFQDWHDKYVELGNCYDQVALVPVVFQSPARFLSLEDRWNATDPGIGRKAWKKEVIVYHYATNICDRLFNQIVSKDRLILPDQYSAEETPRFLRRKRLLKRSQMSYFRYLAINALWRISSPIGS
ncbi:hypothetical protein GCM10009016_08390 [Halomonas beimenensis]